MNTYINPDRIEFVITDACSGRCRHCSDGEHGRNGAGINADAASAAVIRLADRFAVRSVMTFGGEPLLFADTVCKIHSAARDCGIPERPIITNGFFSGDDHKINETAQNLCDSGVPALLRHAESQGVTVDISGSRSACGVCRKAIAVIKERNKTL